MNYFKSLTDFIKLLLGETPLAGVWNKYSIAFTIGVLVLSVLICFLGRRWIKVWCTILGAIAGYICGTRLGALFTQDMETLLICGAVLAVVFAILAFGVVKTGLFLVGFIAGAFIAYVFSGDNLLISGAAALLCALLTCFLGNYVVVICTATGGGLALGSGLGQVLQLGNSVQLGLSIAFVVLGLVVQFRDKRHGKADV